LISTPHGFGLVLLYCTTQVLKIYTVVISPPSQPSVGEGVPLLSGRQSLERSTDITPSLVVYNSLSPSYSIIWMEGMLLSNGELRGIDGQIVSRDSFISIFQNNLLKDLILDIML
jgi:hypothetical protein